jgi:hypothetical protein
MRMKQKKKQRKKMKKRIRNCRFIKMADLSKWPFFKITNSQKILKKFYRLVFGIVGLIDAKGIDIAQPIWS